MDRLWSIGCRLHQSTHAPWRVAASESLRRTRRPPDRSRPEAEEGAAGGSPAPGPYGATATGWAIGPTPVNTRPLRNVKSRMSRELSALMAPIRVSCESECRRPDGLVGAEARALLIGPDVNRVGALDPA